MSEEKKSETLTSEQLLFRGRRRFLNEVKKQKAKRKPLTSVTLERLWVGRCTNVGRWQARAKVGEAWIVGSNEWTPVGAICALLARVVDPDGVTELGAYWKKRRGQLDPWGMTRAALAEMDPTKVRRPL